MGHQDDPGNTGHQDDPGNTDDPGDPGNTGDPGDTAGLVSSTKEYIHAMSMYAI